LIRPKIKEKHSKRLLGILTMGDSYISSDMTHGVLDPVIVLAQWLQSVLMLLLTLTLKKLVSGGSITNTQEGGIAQSV
jgi:hypothetical protein